MSRWFGFIYSVDVKMVRFWYSGDAEMVWLCSSGDVEMVWFWSSGDVKIVWFWSSGDVKMVWFWYSGDVGIVWFCSSGDAKMVWFWVPRETLVRFGFFPRETSNPPSDTLRLPRWHNVSRGTPYVSRGWKSLGRSKKPWAGFIWMTLKEIWIRTLYVSIKTAHLRRWCTGRRK